MEVELYVYDLSKGLARQMSRQFLGIHIDAVYHTSIVFGNVEYFFGAGVQTCYPGSTHHGRPMEVIKLGRTELPQEVILEYLESLKQTYTAESYDLFLHNCNNFSNDFAMFLVGRGIPEHITSLPRTVLNTPFGQMLKPQLDSAMRTVTQAPVPSQRIPPTAAARMAINGALSNGALTNGTMKPAQLPAKRSGLVHNVTSLQDVERLLASASKSCAVIFFTSSTCAPCKLVYPAFDELAEEAGDKAVLIKVDINSAYEVASKYNVRATPTFMTFLKGKKEEEWSGADERRLRGTVRMLLQSAFPSHPHTKLEVPTLLGTSLRPVTFSKTPPLDKLVAKLGDAGRDLSVNCMKDFITARNTEVAQEAPLPDLTAFGAFLRDVVSKLPPEVLFAAYDLLRSALVDPRVSGFYIEEQSPCTIGHLIRHVNGLRSCPHNLRLVTLHMACNLFTSPLLRRRLSSAGDAFELVQLVTASLLDDAHTNIRIAAASLAFNLAAVNHRARLEENHEVLPETDQVELAASLLEALGVETESKEATKGILLALGFLIYCAPADGELADLCKAMDAKGTVLAKERLSGDGKLVKDVAALLR